MTMVVYMDDSFEVKGRTGAYFSHVPKLERMNLALRAARSDTADFLMC